MAFQARQDSIIFVETSKRPASVDPGMTLRRTRANLPCTMPERATIVAKIAADRGCRGRGLCPDPRSGQCE